MDIFQIGDVITLEFGNKRSYDVDSSGWERFLDREEQNMKFTRYRPDDDSTTVLYQGPYPTEPTQIAGITFAPLNQKEQ